LIGSSEEWGDLMGRSWVQSNRPEKKRDLGCPFFREHKSVVEPQSVGSLGMLVVVVVERYRDRWLVARAESWKI
jgi:hypothetical protein